MTNDYNEIRAGSIVQFINKSGKLNPRSKTKGDPLFCPKGEKSWSGLLSGLGLELGLGLEMRWSETQWAEK